jgi:hypothetical protein
MSKVVHLSPRGDDVSAECVIIEKEQRRKNVQLNILMSVDSNPAESIGIGHRSCQIPRAKLIP